LSKNLIIDVDTGIDDAFALLFAALSPDVNLLGVTCVDGNTDIEQVVKNTLFVLNAVSAENIPVAAGARTSLMGFSTGGAPEVHGRDGLGGFCSDSVKTKPSEQQAVELMRELVEQSPQPVSLVAVGPLTNVAMFVTLFPDSAAKLEQIAVMGGSTRGGNATASAEFNIWHDPEAAHIVFSSGIPLTMYGLDVFYDLKMDTCDLTALYRCGKPAAKLAADLMNFLVGTLGSEASLGDYGALASLIYPELSESSKMHVSIDTSHGISRGTTVCDVRSELPLTGHTRQGHACNVILKTDVRKMVEEFVRVLGG